PHAIGQVAISHVPLRCPTKPEAAIGVARVSLVLVARSEVRQDSPSFTASPAAPHQPPGVRQFARTPLFRAVIGAPVADRLQESVSPHVRNLLPGRTGK